MAFPRVFVSSTCYDLTEIRDRLVFFINSWGFEEVVSERGDVFYHPQLHTHESCLQEIQNCQLLVLVIGGRFGGAYVADPTKSIVNAEYLAAKHSGIPVFSFVKSEVWKEHKLYERNKTNQDLISQIEFPSIDKQEHATAIFEFINDVRRSPVNNGIFDFDLARDIEEKLRKQWAGMMFDFLSVKRAESELEVATGLIKNLTLAGKKTEELIELLYKHIAKEEAEHSIAQLDTELEARKFFQRVLSLFMIGGFRSKVGQILSIDPSLPWYRFVASIAGFELRENVRVVSTDDGAEREADLILYGPSSQGLFVSGELTKEQAQRNAELAGLFRSYQRLGEDERRKVVSDFAPVEVGEFRTTENGFTFFTGTEPH